MKYRQIRQSSSWEKYLNKLNWETHRTSNGILVPFLKSPLGVLNKIQRPDNFSADDLIEIESLCKDKKSIFIKIELGLAQDVNILEKSSYEISLFPLSPPSVQVFDLNSSEQILWNDISRSGKYSIKRAYREGTHINFFRNPSDEKLKRFYEVEVETGKYGKFYVQPFREIKFLKDSFGEEAYLIEAVDDNNKLIGIKLFLGHDGVVNYTLGGTTSYGRTTKGGYALVWDAMLYFKEKGYEILDMEGMYDERFPKFTRNWESFTHFKQKFGGSIVRYPEPYIKLRSPILKFFSKFQKLPL